jgi:hypothetical protein
LIIGASRALASATSWRKTVLKVNLGSAVLLVTSLGITTSSIAQSSAWNGPLATLFQAQAACANPDSNECLPYRAEAVAVAQVLSQQVKLPAANGKDEGYGIVFHDGYEQNCSSNWLQSMNAQTLLHSALGLAVGVSDAQRLNWVAALLQASQQLCHS